MGSTGILGRPTYEKISTAVQSRSTLPCSTLLPTQLDCLLLRDWYLGGACRCCGARVRRYRHRVNRVPLRATCQVWWLAGHRTALQEAQAICRLLVKVCILHGSLPQISKCKLFNIFNLSPAFCQNFKFGLGSHCLTLFIT